MSYEVWMETIISRLGPYTREKQTSVEWKIRLVKEVSRPQFWDYCQRLHKHPMQTFKSNGQWAYPQNEQGNFLTEAEAMDWQIPYNPIELG